MQNIRNCGKFVRLRTGVQYWDIRWIHVPFLLTIRYRPDIRMWLISFTQQGENSHPYCCSRVSAKECMVQMSLWLLTNSNSLIFTGANINRPQKSFREGGF